MKLSKLSQQAVNGGAIITDPRFACLHSDPRFQRVARNKLKVPIDSRFRHMFSDKSFLDPLGVDKRGKPKKKREKRHSLHRYYQVDDDDDDAELEAGKGKPTSNKVENDVGIENSSVSVAALEVNDRLTSKGDEADRKGSTLDNRGTLSRKKKNKFDQARRREDPIIESSGKELRNPKSEESGSLTTPEPEGNVDVDGLALKARRNSKEAESHRVGISTRVDDGKDSSDEDPESSEDTDDSELSAESSDTESSTSSSDEGSEEEPDLSTEEAEEEKVAVTDKETRRLALVNMDWDHITAFDILVVMNSFVPKGGHIISVSVYPSAFGLEQMKEEESQGPKKLFESEGGVEDDDEGDDEIDMEKLRQYEKAKLRYFYAVIECDSSSTADFLYKSCDGMEFERTSNTLDLRFIPDDMKFEHSPREVASEVPVGYQAPQFETRALQHSTVKLTWDDDEPTRVKTLHQKFNTEQLNDMDFKAYLASDASEDEEDEENKREGTTDISEKETAGCEAGVEALNESQGGKVFGKKKLRDKYRALLLGSDDVLESKDSEDKDNDRDMEITFNSGLDELSKRLMDKNKKQGEETVWEAYLRKKKEKRKERKKLDVEEDELQSADELHSADGQQSFDPFFDQNDKDFDDPFFNSREDAPLDDENFETEMNDSERGSIKQLKSTSRLDKGERARRRVELEQKKIEEERSKAELELLLADEHGVENGVKGYNLKKKRPKGKRKDDKIQEKLPTVDYDDPRFSALFTSHHFAVDPTEPQFKRSAAQLRSLVERQQKQISQADQEGGKPKFSSSVNSEKNDDSGGMNSNKRKHELSLMVRSLKRKVGANR